MPAAPAGIATSIDVRGISIEATVCGKGRDILFLHSGSWLVDEAPFIERLSAHGRVIAPVHPGFGSTDAPLSMTNVDDLAYLYLDLIDTMQLENVVLIGASFGGWIAAEMVVKGATKVTALALIDAFGVKAGGREERDITDIFATPDADIATRSYVDPRLFHSEVKDLTDDQLARRVRSREALARYGWSPYMHDPKLPGRLHRVRAASLVLWGAQDRMVAESCAQLYARNLPNARFVKIEKAAHLPHLEQPEAVLQHLATLLGDNGAEQSTRSREAV
jgi:pimeloyl-ACP methyl ester carboxylesterase